MNLQLSVIRLDGGTQAREELDQQVVARYAEHMQEGDKFPPIVVFHDGSNHWLADGFHRYFATKTIGGLEIECEVRPGTVRDAELYSYGANGNKRGLGWSSADIRKILTKMLMDEEWKKWSDTQIAKHVGVSKMTVGRVRHSLEEQGKIEPKKSRTYVNKHGNKSEMKTEKISKTKKESKPKEEAKKEVKKEDPAFDDKITELTDTITQLHEENTLLKDKVAIGQWDASEIEKIDAEELIADLRNQIKILEMENKSLRESRDTYQNRNSELMRTVKALTNKLKKAGIE
jgi:DNA-binding transcriptional regulator YhcF (GntR family)